LQLISIEKDIFKKFNHKILKYITITHTSRAYISQISGLVQNTAKNVNIKQKIGR